MAGFDADGASRFRVAVTRISKGVDRQVDAGELTRTQTSVLSTVSRLGPLSAGELARLEGLNPTMLSRLVGKLEGLGLLTRAPDPADKRVTVLAVTREGRAVHQRLRRERVAVFTRTLREVGPDHTAALLAALPALEALAAALAPQPAPATTRRQETSVPR